MATRNQDHKRVYPPEALPKERYDRPQATNGDRTKEWPYGRFHPHSEELDSEFAKKKAREKKG